MNRGGITLSQKLRRKPAHERRAELLDMAVLSYLEMGLGRAGHGDVAKRAGVSTGTVFNYFPNREALTQAVITHVASVVADMFADMKPPSQSVEDNISRFQARIDLGCARYPDVIKLYLSWSHSYSPELRDAFLEFQSNLAMRAMPYVHPEKGAISEVAEFDSRIVLSTCMVYMQMFFDGTSSSARDKFAERVATLVSSAIK